MEESVHLGEVAGIRIGANWSLVIVFWLITWGLAGDVLPHSAKGYSTAEYWIAGSLVALLFYGCLLAHELSHALVARRAGIEVEGIVLWLFGGVSQLKGEAANPDTELRVGVVGPVTSVVLGLVFFILTQFVDGFTGFRLLGAALGWLGWMNGILGTFNLLPAFPLDGGRVLRAALWRRHGDKLRATETAAASGRVFGFLMIGLGLFEFAAGGGLGGLWLMFLGWFLLTAARAEAGASAMSDTLAGVRVRDVMTPDPVVVPAGITVEELLEQWIYPSRFSSFPVVNPDGSLRGLVTLGHVKQVPRDERTIMTVDRIAVPMDEVVTCASDELLLPVIGRLSRSPEQRALVLDSGRLTGIISPRDVARAMQHAELLRTG